jgi:transposase-like protein
VNNRIYPEAAIMKAIADLKNKLLHCPKCFSNNINYKEGNLVWFHDYKCFECNSLFNKSEAITKDTVRDKKIKKVLRKK